MSTTTTEPTDLALEASTPALDRWLEWACRPAVALLGLDLDLGEEEPGV